MSEILAVSIPTAGEMLGLGRSTIYRLIKEGQLKPKKVGTRTLIRTADLKTFLGSQALARQSDVQDSTSHLLLKKG